MMRNILIQVTPPFLVNIARKLLRTTPSKIFYGVEGEFASWKEASDYCSTINHQDGYEAINILEKVGAAIEEVRKGKAEFERDGVLFYRKDYNFQLLSALFLAFAGIKSKSLIHVVDYGGSLGSTFFQNRSLFSTLNQTIVWSVIEQPNFVEFGRENVPEVSFYYDIDEYVKTDGTCDILLLSAVLDYLPDSDATLNKLLSYSWKYILIDRSFYHPSDKEVIAIQNVPPSIYDASYPLRLRSISKQDRIMKESGYKQIMCWNSSFSMPYLQEPNKKEMVPLKGFLYAKI